MKREPKIVIVTDTEILQLYWGGYTIDRLVRYVAGNERCTKSDAKQRVENLIYKSVMEAKDNG